jgi:predicted DNA-binding transcriptional regulator AlpA
MAKQAGPYKIIGVILNLQFYKMEGNYYVRRKSSLTGNRVKKDKAFTLTMVYANVLGTASKIASAVYQQIPKESRNHSQFNQLMKRGQKMLILGISADQIYEQLYSETFPPKPEIMVRERSFRQSSFADEIINRIFSVPVKERQDKINTVLSTFPP